MTLPRVTGSSSRISGTFTRLKKYSNPTHRTPAVMWTQRKNINQLVLASCTSSCGAALASNEMCHVSMPHLQDEAVLRAQQFTLFNTGSAGCDSRDASPAYGMGLAG